MKNSFSRAYRLRHQDDFKEVFRQSRKRRCGRIQKLENYLLYQYDHDESPRVGLSISKKVARRANVRNRIKRCLREFFRTNKNLFRGDTIIRLQKMPRSLSYHDVVDPIQAKLRK